MKLNIFVKFLPALLIIFLFSGVSFAQEPNTQLPANQNAATTENDHLPFMQSEQTPDNQQQTANGKFLAKTIGATLLIVSLLFFGAWGLKKFGFGKSNQNNLSDALELAVLSTVSMGKGRTISTVRFGERILVVGSTSENFTLLADEKCGEAVSSKAPRSVAELLSEENLSFENELDLANNKLSFSAAGGGRI